MIDQKYQEIIKAAEMGGQVIKKYFGRDLAVKIKSTVHDFQTKADLESEEIIIRRLQKKFPGYNILAEETGFIDKGSEYTFVVDPLDGSNNFVLNIPMVSVSIGLMKGEEAIFGAVYDVFLDRIYFAQKGRGAHCGGPFGYRQSGAGKKLNVGKQRTIKESNVAYNCGYIFSERQYVEIFRKLRKAKIKRYFNNWSVALDFCLLAAGKIDGIINNKCEIYDFIAGKLIAKEAGAVVTDFRGRNDRDKNNEFIASCGGKTHRDLLKIIL